MPSILRPTPVQTTRRFIVLAATLFAILVGYGQQAGGWGQTAAEFAADSDATLKVAGYAFSIWGVIYLGLLIYAVRQVLPQTGESDMINRFGWPSAVALFGIGLWIVASAADWETATIVIIFASLLALVVPLVLYSGLIRTLPKGDRDRWMTLVPLSLLAGWLTVAAPLNLITVLTGNGALPGGLPPTGWAMLAIALVVLAGLTVTQRIRTMAYSLPIAWGLIGAFVAELDRNPTLAFFALTAAIAVLIGAVLLVFRLRPGIERDVRPSAEADRR